MLKTYFLKYWDDQARDYFFMTVKLRQNLKKVISSGRMVVDT